MGFDVPKLRTVLFTFEEISAAVSRVAEQIEEDLDFRETWHALVVMNGAFVFAAHLFMKMERLAPRVRFIQAHSYSGTEGSSEVVLGDFPTDLGDNILVVEDIVDTGRTMSRILTLLGGTRNIKVVSLLNKPSRREVEVPVDYAGIELTGSPFVVGFGMDLDGDYIGLCDIWEVSKL